MGISTRTGQYINTYTDDGEIDITILLPECNETLTTDDVYKAEEVMKLYINDRITQDVMDKLLQDLVFPKWGCELIVRRKMV